MTLGTDLADHLTTYAGLVALVGDRSYPIGDTPEDPTVPYVAYRRTDGVRERGIARAVAATRAFYEFEAWAADYPTADAIRAQLRAALLAFTGSTVTVHDLTVDDEPDDYDYDTRLHVHRVEAEILAGGDA